MKFILFTKTLWAEPPRIRHQVADMLVKYGHDVVFFQKNSAVWGRRQSDADGAIQLRRHAELLYHQLRPFKFLAEMNARYEKIHLRQMVNDCSDAIVLNFCYDYYFLRDLFPHNPIISIINDDFVARAKWFMKREAQRVLGETVRTSDHALVVSYPLLDQVRTFTNRVSLFLPWARRSYSRPQDKGDRDEVLYWGYINERIDWDVIKKILDEGIKINFVGPISSSKRIHKLLGHENAVYHGVAQLDEIEDVLVSCVCSILPYDLGFRRGALEATTASNRTFDLLSCGLPLLYSNFPSLIDAPGDVIYVCATWQDYVRAYEMTRKRFVESQISIANFLRGHSEKDRYQQLMGYIENVRKQKMGFLASARPQ